MKYTCLKIKYKGPESVGQQMAVLEWNQKTKLVSITKEKILTPSIRYKFSDENPEPENGGVWTS